MPRVLIGPGVLRGQPGPFRDVLTQAGFELIDPDGPDILTPEMLREILPTVDAQLCGGEVMSADMIPYGRQLRVIARVGVGYDAVNIDAASQNRTLVTITPGTNHGSVAEHAFGLLLALTRDVIIHDNAIKVDGWNRSIVRPLRGQTLGLVGLGRIGQAVATRALAFEMNVIAHDPYADVRFANQHGISLVSFEDLLKQSDVLSLHIPCDSKTKGMFNRDCFQMMKPGSILINTARGGLVNEPDLLEALQSGHLFGAGLDVMAVEPPPDGHPLTRLPNVVLSPHIAGIDTKALSDMAELAARCVVDLHEGRWPEGCVVNSDLRGSWTWNRG